MASPTTATGHGLPHPPLYLLSPHHMTTCAREGDRPTEQVRRQAWRTVARSSHHGRPYRMRRPDRDSVVNGEIFTRRVIVKGLPARDVAARQDRQAPPPQSSTSRSPRVYRRASPAPSERAPRSRRLHAASGRGGSRRVVGLWGRGGGGGGSGGGVGHQRFDLLTVPLPRARSPKTLATMATDCSIHHSITNSSERTSGRSRTSSRARTSARHSTPRCGVVSYPTPPNLINDMLLLGIFPDHVPKPLLLLTHLNFARCPLLLQDLMSLSLPLL